MHLSDCTWNDCWLFSLMLCASFLRLSCPLSIAADYRKWLCLSCAGKIKSFTYCSKCHLAVLCGFFLSFIFLSFMVRQTTVIQLRRSVCSLFWQSDCSQIAAFVWSVWQYFCVLGRRAHCLSSLPLAPSSHHLIKEQGRIQCFLITLLLALRPSFNDETSAQGGLDICFIIIILHLISGAAVCFRRWGLFLCVCVCVCICVCARVGALLCTRQPSSLFFVVIFRLSLFALGLKIWCPDLERAFFFRPHPRLPLRVSPQRRPLEFQAAPGSMTKSVQGEGEIQGRSHLL